jgi:murein peptide amidase A
MPSIKYSVLLLALAAASAFGDPPPDGSDAVRGLCRRIDAKLSSVSLAECLAARLTDSGATSIEHTALAYRDVEPSGVPEARVLLVGGIHGDEFSSVSVVFKWLTALQRQPDARFYWRIVPLLNPDGLLMPPAQSRRMNAHGVDLNRNFPTADWDQQAWQYWVNIAQRNERRYPGPAPLSEPETAWLVSQIESFHPDAVVSVHAPYGVVDCDGPDQPPNRLGPLELQLLGTYPGSMGRYVGVNKGIPMLTVELESAEHMPTADDVAAIWRDMVNWLDKKVGKRGKLAANEKSPAKLD